MKLIQFPSYCGGRILYGLGSGQVTHTLPVRRMRLKEGIRQSPGYKVDHNHYSQSAESYVANLDSYQVVKNPDIKLTAQESLIISDLTRHGIIPVRYAGYTNPYGRKSDYNDWYSTTELAKLDIPRYGGFPSGDYTSFSPDVKEDFFYLLHHLLNYSGSYAFVHAVTNGAQAKKAEWLMEAGFTVSGKGAKPGGNTCTNWIGRDREIGPFLKKFANVRDFHKESFQY